MKRGDVKHSQGTQNREFGYADHLVRFGGQRYVQMSGSRGLSTGYNIQKKTPKRTYGKKKRMQYHLPRQQIRQFTQQYIYINKKR